MPNGAGPFPAVVLVHGSGPNDRDETIGPNKPFKDLAWGLATRGIAVLRYEKRTQQCPSQMIASMATLTVDEEVVNDALAAVERLRGVPAVDSARIVVLGHSLGGMVAPRIGARDPRLAGLVLMAAGTRNLADRMLEQNEYLARLDGTIAPDEEQALEDLRRQVERVKALDFKEGEVILGAGKAYWADILAYDPVATARSLTLPLLILQGERDYQVTMTDFAAWQAGLAGREGTEFKSYPGLNHLFMAGSGQPNPAEYNVAGNVAPEVVDDIAAWVARVP